MNAFIALLRAVNVGGTGKMPMKDLKALCERAGFVEVQTYIASGNVNFKSNQSEPKLKSALESSLEKYAGKSIGVMIRTVAEMADVLSKNPFPNAVPNRTVAIFLDSPPPLNALEDVVGIKDEQIRLGKREMYISYDSGMADSKLKIPAARAGTARNMNTVGKLIALAQKL